MSFLTENINLLIYLHFLSIKQRCIMSKIVNEYGVIDREIVLKNIGLNSAVELLTSELKTFAQVFDLNGEEIDQLYRHFASEISFAGVEEKLCWSTKRRKELREKL